MKRPDIPWTKQSGVGNDDVEIAYGYTYDDAGRMASFSINGVEQAEYEYNYLGQQYKRTLTQTGQTILSAFDPWGSG